MGKLRSKAAPQVEIPWITVTVLYSTVTVLYSTVHSTTYRRTQFTAQFSTVNFPVQYIL